MAQSWSMPAPGDGFHIPMIEAKVLADLHRWNEHVIGIILRSATGRLSRGVTEPGPAVDTAIATAALSPCGWHKRRVRRTMNRQFVTSTQASMRSVKAHAPVSAAAETTELSGAR
ncbi:MAG: hypothetical protein ACK4TC_15045 [Sphingomonas pseudosanguinis]|uniref:hypothetical protein n=1 Tax=Sphingomonas pseudosanguinis TaxID=413712 RepID=UPI00391BB0F6